MASSDYQKITVFNFLDLLEVQVKMLFLREKRLVLLLVQYKNLFLKEREQFPLRLVIYLTQAYGNMRTLEIHLELKVKVCGEIQHICLLYTSPSPRD